MSDPENRLEPCEECGGPRRALVPKDDQDDGREGTALTYAEPPPDYVEDNPDDYVQVTDTDEREVTYHEEGCPKA